MARTSSKASLPLVIVWLGIDESAKIFLVILGVMFPVYINTYHGIRTVDPNFSGTERDGLRQRYEESRHAGSTFLARLSHQ